MKFVIEQIHDVENGNQEKIEERSYASQSYMNAKYSLKNFILCGHSFGGYIAGNYALKYQTNIRKLIMLSPIGVRPGDESEIDFSEADLEKKFVGMQN